MPNPLRQDPTRTTMIRKRFVAETKRRFAKIRKEVWNLVYVEDAFGLADDPSSVLIPLRNMESVRNERFAFLTDSGKVGAFRDWMEQQVRDHVISLPAGAPLSDAWTSKYIESSYKAATVRSYIDARKESLSHSHDFYQGTQAQFLESAFNSPTRVSQIELLYTRTYENLRGITDGMSHQLSSHLATGMIRGDGPREIARVINKQIEGIERKRALTLARTEVINAYAEGQLDTFEDLGIEEVGAYAEWSTAGDDLVCPLCAPLEGVVLTVKEARGILPRHPNCRCAWIPAFPEMKEKGMKTSKQSIDNAIRKSLRAEKPKAKSTKEARRSSTWMGAGKRVRKR